MKIESSGNPLGQSMCSVQLHVCIHKKNNTGTFTSCSPVSDAFKPATLDISCHQHYYKLSRSKLGILDVNVNQNS